MIKAKGCCETAAAFGFIGQVVSLCQAFRLRPYSYAFAAGPEPEKSINFANVFKNNINELRQQDTVILSG
jgi:hypothetical protein